MASKENGQNLKACSSDKVRDKPTSERSFNGFNVFAIQNRWRYVGGANQQWAMAVVNVWIHETYGGLVDS